MLGILYLVISIFTGYHFLKRFIPGIFSISETRSFFGKPVKLDNWMVTLPASFLTGTLLMTWSVYLCSYAFHTIAQSPMLYGNIITFALFSAMSIYIIIKKKQAFRDFFKETANTNNGQIVGFIRGHMLELSFIIIVTVIWSYFMFRSFYVKDGTMHIGISVFSDFAPHLAVIRSFSLGSNFPTEYPHFADGTIRYHFLFQFLAGNLEYLGLRLDWAFNLPSILSLLSFLMLLYSFAVITMGKPWIGIITSILFFFRSSFAFFTFTGNMGSLNEIINRVLTNRDSHIGNTLHEEWGLWAQKVYVNQRHLAFALGIFMLILIVVLPLFKKMLFSLRRLKISAEGNLIANMKNWLREFIFSKDAWLPENVLLSAAAGLILGALSFWNGAVVVAALPILFVLAVFSKHRLQYFNIAVITIILSLIQVRFFTGAESQAVEPRLTIGFLSGSRNITGILRFYVELLGILPIMFIVSIALSNKKYRIVLSFLLIALTAFTILKYTPVFGVEYKYLIGGAVLISILAVTFYGVTTVPKGSLTPALAFITPIILATTLQLTPDITVNHKYVILSCILINIFIAGMLYHMFASRRAAVVILALVLSFLMTITGIADIITLYNHDRGHIQHSVNDELLLWTVNETGPNEIFLTHPITTNPILLAGRKIYCGHGYYPWSAGYDSHHRYAMIKEIYESTDINKVKTFLKDNDISYIVIDSDVKNPGNYKLNEQLFRDGFSLVYSNNGIDIYRTY